VGSQARTIVFTFEDERRVGFRLLWEHAPRTCAGIVGALPFEGSASHAMYSGPAAVFFFTEELALEPEHATTELSPNELVYTYYPPNWRRGYPEHTSEVYWSYATPARATVPGLFIPALGSVFAAHDGFAGELQAFHRWSASLHREGAKPVRVEAIT
jgi:hypothetical protein